MICSSGSATIILQQDVDGNADTTGVHASKGEPSDFVPAR